MLLKGYADNWRSIAIARTGANVMPDRKPRLSVMPFANRFEANVLGLREASLAPVIVELDRVRPFPMFLRSSILSGMMNKETWKKVTLWFDHQYYSRRDSVRFHDYKRMCIARSDRRSWKLYFRRLSCYRECCFQRIRCGRSLKGLWEWVCG